MITFGPYELERRLGVGGMAEVWLARREGRAVVIKRVLPHLSESEKFVKLFEREGRIAATLVHPNIARVFEVGEVTGDHFLAMEWIDGLDLGAFLRSYLSRHLRPTPLGFAAGVVSSVARALSYAHSLGVIHRDVTPGNVMLGRDGSVKLVDFGIAKIIEESCERSLSTMRGKMGYVAPEILDGARGDHRIDIFALGVLLHEMLTGRRLFKGATDFHTLAMIHRGAVPPPSEANPEVPPELDAICLRAVAHDPPARTADAIEVARALDALAARRGWDRSAWIAER